MAIRVSSSRGYRACCGRIPQHIAELVQNRLLVASEGNTGIVPLVVLEVRVQ